MAEEDNEQEDDCKTRENFKFKFFKKKRGCKTVIYGNSPEKSWDFSRSRMTKRIAPLESSREIKLPNRISLNSEIVAIPRILRQRVSGDTWRTMW